jgi:pSer/pThr/pTyr-binding forkhead associated (FHA) protein
MSARIIITAMTGPLRGQDFVFTSWTVCTIGRSTDCLVRIPGDPSNLIVSRHHCLLEIEPPVVRVCDLGSLNGTFVNGLPIGHRARGTPSWKTASSAPETVEVHDGDRLVVGSNEFLVTIRCGPQYGKPSTGTPKQEVEGSADRTVYG